MTWSQEAGRVEIRRFDSPKITHTCGTAQLKGIQHFNLTSASVLVSLHEQVWYAEIIVFSSYPLVLLFLVFSEVAEFIRVITWKILSL
jgi:hypothetical protein